jgi:polysaccharide pyruvyl transferase WcaK-like protein
LPDELPPGYDPKWNVKEPNEPLDRGRAAKYLELMEALIRKTGGKVLIAPEAKKEMVHNRRLLYQPLPENLKERVVNLDHFWNADEAASVFAQASTVICHEPHSPILALANGTPILHTHSEEHGPKSYMFRDLGLGEWLFDHDLTPASGMIDALFAMQGDPAAASRKVQEAMRTVHSLRAASMRPLQALLGRG